MLAPSLVVVDTSATVEALVSDAPLNDRYRQLFRELRACDARLVWCELLEVELLEAAFAWDVRRERGRDWRRERRTGELQRTRALEQTIVADWRAFTAGIRTSVISTASLLEDAASMMGTTGLGSADAVHLAVARSLGAPILTHDRLMIHAARRWPGVLTERSP